MKFAKTSNGRTESWSQGYSTFLIGISEGEASKIKVLKLIRGAQPYPMFKEALDSLLTSQK